MEPIEADLAITEDDYVEAFEAQGKKGGRTIAWFLAIVAALTVAIAALGWPVTPGVWILLVPAAIAGIVLAPRQSAYSARRAYRTVPAAWHTVRVVLDEAQLRVRSDVLESYRPWSHVDGWLETPRLFVLLGGAAVSDVWPKAAFDEAACARVRVLLQERMAANAALRPPATTSAKAQRVRAFVLWAALVTAAVVAYVLWYRAA